jgi:hypothetical protein
MLCVFSHYLHVQACAIFDWKSLVVQLSQKVYVLVVYLTNCNRKALLCLRHFSIFLFITLTIDMNGLYFFDIFSFFHFIKTKIFINT